MKGPYTVSVDTPGAPAASVRQLLDAMKAAQYNMAPPGNWILIAPDGRVWADPDPRKIMRQFIVVVPMKDFL